MRYGPGRVFMALGNFLRSFVQGKTGPIVLMVGKVVSVN